MDELDRLINGKSVAIVATGPATSAGKEIDSFDVVVRVNGEFPLCPLLHGDRLGTRTDIFFCSRKHRAVVQHQRLEHFARRLKMVCVYCYKRRWREHKLESIRKLKLRWVDPKVQNWYPTLRIPLARPTLGYLAILDILRCNPSRLKLFGFTFFQGDGRYYLPGYQSRRRDIGSELHPWQGEKSPHSMRNEFKVVRSLLRRCSVIEIDAGLQEVLNSGARGDDWKDDYSGPLELVKRLGCMPDDIVAVGNPDYDHVHDLTSRFDHPAVHYVSHLSAWDERFITMLIINLDHSYGLVSRELVEWYDSLKLGYLLVGIGSGEGLRLWDDLFGDDCIQDGAWLFYYKRQRSFYDSEI